MAEGNEQVQEKVSNSCCAALTKKHTKLLEKYKKLEVFKNQFRDCLDMVGKKYDLIEKENESLKKELDELKVQAKTLKDENTKETGIRNNENEVSALKDEIQFLKQNSQSVSDEACKQLQKRLDMAEKEIKALKINLEKERDKVFSERQNAEFEKKKADEALKKAEVEKKRSDDAQKLINIEKRKAEENRLMLEKLKVETDSVKANLVLEKKKVNEALRKAEVEMKKASEAHVLADVQRKKAEETRLMLEKMEQETKSIKSMLDMYQSKFESKAKVVQEKRDAGLAGANDKRSETNSRKPAPKKDRVSDLNKKIKMATAKRLDDKLKKSGSRSCSEALVDEACNLPGLVPGNNVCWGIQSDSVVAQLVEKLLWEKERNVIRQKKKANKLKKVAEAHKKEEIVQKNRADQLSGQVEMYKLRLEQLQKELQELVSFNVYAGNSTLRCNSVVSKTDTVNLLKTKLKLEKKLVRHAKKLSKVEALRNNVLHNEVLNLGQECLCLQHRIYLLEKSFCIGGGGTLPSEKVGIDTCLRKSLCSVGDHNQVFSGTDSRLDPAHRSCNKKTLHSSVINSTSASFSEPTFMGSQERGTLLVSTSVKLGEDISDLEPSMSKFSENMQVSNTGFHTSLVHGRGENSLKHDTMLVRSSPQEKMRVQNADASIKILCLNGERLRKFDHQQDDPEPCNLKKMSKTPSKRRKTSYEEPLVLYNLQGYDGTKGRPYVDVDHIAAQPDSSVMRLNQCFKDRKSKSFEHQLYASDDFGEMATFDCMKLLDLDNDSDESAYRRAFALPLSPSLPEINFEEDEKLELDNDDIFSDKNFPSTFGCNVDDAIASKLLEVRNEVDCIKNSVKENDTLLITEASRASTSGKGKHNELYERTTAPSSGHLVKYIFMFTENNSQTSILKILRAVDSCSPPCTFLHTAEAFLQKILRSLLNAEDLSGKDKICALFSLLLHEINEAGQKNLPNSLTSYAIQALDLASVRIHSALSDSVLRKMFMESISLFELNVFIEDFFLQRKVFAYDSVPPEFEAQSISKVELFLNGNALTLYEVVASEFLLVASAWFFASVCSALDQVGFICEMSCNIISMLKYDPKVLMAILHVFARVCGSKYFTLKEYSMAITVVKSIVVVLEKQALSASSAATSSCSVVGKPSETLICRGNCPFSEDAMAIHNVASMLLDKLQKHANSDSDFALKLANFSSFLPLDHNEKIEEVSCSNDNILDFMDVLSLIEIIASFMGWDWAYDHIIIQIFKYLDAHQMDDRSAVTIVLLSQLGRIGVDAFGYEDPRVNKVQQWLSASVSDSRFLKLSFLYQFVIVKSLFGLIPLKFEEVIDGEKVETSEAVLRHWIPGRCIQKWFCELNDEQKCLLNSSLIFPDC